MHKLSPHRIHAFLVKCTKLPSTTGACRCLSPVVLHLDHVSLVSHIWLDVFNFFRREQAFNNSSIRTVAAIREALADARYEAEQRDGDGDGGTLLTKVR